MVHWQTGYNLFCFFALFLHHQTKCSKVKFCLNKIFNIANAICFAFRKHFLAFLSKQTIVHTTNKNYK